MDQRRFDIAWKGRCASIPDSSRYCSDHRKLVCRSCGKQATHGCGETSGLVCGATLCDECEHTLCENGCNSGAPLPDRMEDHCKKKDQVFKPWYMEGE